MKGLSLERKGVIAMALLKTLPPPTETEISAAAKEIGIPVSQAKMLMAGEPHKHGKLTKVS